MKKLSEQLREGSQRIAAWENQLAAIREQNQREYDAPVAEAQARVRAFHAAFVARLDSMADARSAQWRDLANTFSQHLATVRQRAEEHQAAVDREDAHVEAGYAEIHAQVAADFAQLVAADAAATTLEARRARAYVNALEEAARGGANL
jgi:hypothetical protein